MALDGVSWVWGRRGCNRSRPMGSTACDSIDAITHALPRAVLRSGARFGLLSLAALILRGLELGAMPEHGVHDDGESAGQAQSVLFAWSSAGQCRAPTA